MTRQQIKEAEAEYKADDLIDYFVYRGNRKNVCTKSGRVVKFLKSDKYKLLDDCIGKTVFINWSTGVLSNFDEQGQLSTYIPFKSKDRFSIMKWFKTKRNHNVDTYPILCGLLERRGYIKDSYKGGELWSKGFVFVVINGNTVTISHDIKQGGEVLSIGEISGIVNSIKYFERI